jgi:hypothetical protein
MIDLHRCETEARIEALADFIKEFRSTLIQQRDQARIKIDREYQSLEKMDEYVGDEDLTVEQRLAQGEEFTVSRMYMGFAYKYYDYLPRTFNYSCIIQIFTLLEERGKLLCEDILKKDPELIFSVKDLEKKDGGDIECIRLFLEKQCKVKLGEWSNLQTLRKLRNDLVHANGKASQSHKTFYKTVKGIEINSEDLIRIKDEYVDSALKSVTDTLQYVFTEMKYNQSMRIRSWPEHIVINRFPGTRVLEIKECEPKGTLGPSFKSLLT